MSLSDEIDDHVDTLAPSRLFHPFGKVLRPIVDSVCRAVRESRKEIKLPLLGCRCKNCLPEIELASGKVDVGTCARLEGLCELNGGNSNTFM